MKQVGKPEEKREKRVTIKIPKGVAKEFRKRIKSGNVAGVKIIAQKLIGNDVSFAVEFDRVIDADALNIGFHLNEQKYISAAIVKARELQKNETKEPPKELVLTFGSEIRKEFLQHCKESLRIKSTVADITGKKTKFYFDISDVNTTGQLALRMEQIMDAVHSIQENKRLKRDNEYCDAVLNHLNSLPEMTESKYVYTEMSGEMLIKSGECTAFNSKSITANIFQKFLNILFGRFSRKFDYYYFSQLVDVDKYYIVLHAPKPFESPRVANHRKNIFLAYQYGEQVYAGNGIFEVENYYKSILYAFNEALSVNKPTNEDSES